MQMMAFTALGKKECAARLALLILLIMSMESDTLRGLDLTEVIHQFALREARKVIL